MSEISNHNTPDWPGAIGSAIAIAIGSAALAYSGTFSMLGSVFPRTIASLMIALGLIYIVFTLRGRTDRGPRVEGSNVRRVGVMVVMLAWAFTLEPMGFLPSSAAAFVVLLALANYDRWTARRAVGFAAASVLMLGGFYFLFKHLLKVPLP
jgi:putative tricarboxylic transport membrane protein